MVYYIKILTNKKDKAMQNEIKELISNYLIEKNLSGSCSIQDNRFLSFKSREEYGTIKKIRQHSIMYIEKKGHMVVLHTRNGVFSFYSSLKKLSEKLDPDAFVRVHQGYIVNVNEIKMVYTDYLSLISIDKPIPISRRNRGSLNKFTLPS